MDSNKINEAIEDWFNRNFDLIKEVIPKIIAVVFSFYLAFTTLQDTFSEETPFNTFYKVEFISIDYQVKENVFELPKDINNIKAVKNKNGYDMYVFYNNAREKVIIEHGVVKVLRFEKVR